MEWGIKTTYFDIKNEQYTQARLSFIYGSDTKTQYIVGYENNDAVNKRAAFTAGIHFNF